MTILSQNEVVLEGTVSGTPVLSHENHGTRFYRFFLEVPRLSGTPDTLPVLLPEALLPQVDAGGPVHIQGQLRSFNNRSGVGSRMVLTVYALDIGPGEGQAQNHIRLRGTLCKPPVYLPVIAWGQLAVETSRLQVGDPVALEGRVQSRIYHKVTEEGTQERVAYEVSMMHILPGEE